ncbi:MAG TPA: TIGR02391 family protein [Terriglobia bacterium]|nr:TIGR02391 family protein [Terriglobia bacterium]
MAIASFAESHIRKLAEILADAYTHGELSGLLVQCGIAEQGGNPKWERVLLALAARQKADRCGNNVGAFIQAAMDPARFVGRTDDFAKFRDRLNEVLAFSGLHLGEDGKLKSVTQARTLTEAQERAGRLRNYLLQRNVHPDVLQFCRVELLQENYFHAVFEAAKSVAEKIRDKTGLTGDGADIVDKAFSLTAPLLAINTLRTETEQSEQKGFANLLKGMFGTFRNVTAHAPKITWPIPEQDALDLLSLVSYLHRRLDAATQVCGMSG